MLKASVFSFLMYFFQHSLLFCRSFVDFWKSSYLSSRSWTGTSIKRGLIDGMNHAHSSPTTTEKLYLTPNILIENRVFAIMKSNIPINQLDFHTGFVRWWFDKNTAVRISVTTSFLLVVLFIITGGCFCCCCCCCKPCKKKSKNRVVWKRKNKVRVILCLYSAVRYILFITLRIFYYLL